MLTRFIRIQLVLFTILTIVALVVLGWYYLRIPSLVGIGQYELKAELPRSGGLYATANVTYRGTQIGKVTSVEPTQRGALAVMSIDDRYKIPADATANVHSVSAIGEQYLDLVSTGDADQYLSPGSTITESTVPSEVGPALDAANRGLAVLPKEKIDALLTETSQAVGGLGPALQRLVDSTTNIAQGFKDHLPQVNDIIVNAGPILDSQVQSGDNIEQWSRNLNVIAAQSAEQDAALRSGLQQAAPTADQLNAVFGGVRESLPQTLANLAIVTDMLKRYNKGLEQSLVLLPQGAAVAQAGTLFEGYGQLPLALGALNQPPPCLTGFLPASEWRSPADTSMAPLPRGTYCKIPKDYQGNVVRGARNYPCVDVPGKRAATPMECRSDEPYVPLGTNPWYGDPNQILSCPAPGARCDQGVNPGRGVIQAPSVNSGMNPAPASDLPPPNSTAPVSDPLSPPGQGSVTCSGQQPNPCIYTPAPGPPGSTAVYSPSSGQVVGPDGVKYNVSNSSNPGDDGWKEMLAPAS
ncbi:MULTISPECIES: virulence factor Mce family protein [Mycobacteriaceae]|uniref:MCE family protein n=2 Tax=Mycolicibacterium TaxID=1866885 RepID=A0AAW5SV69_MYCNV|nr:MULTISPECIES: MlaD family protein [Mycobacteriaceae]MCV7026962.1 MCE family protein [Mycolicibacterium novocastrense]MCV7238168.1 MCE family protein [Mycolicibacterium celeriflavum]OBB48578.1 mammalian cell entry protein [Mycobacterium sp. 852002-51961_SCH5331710]OBG97752.1 mammalian cell entry protein [Mycobacterium sp. E136]OBK76397.1 mammalian cell entry protein [Mycobacterium sp. 1164985.4]